MRRPHPFRLAFADEWGCGWAPQLVRRPFITRRSAAISPSSMSCCSPAPTPTRGGGMERPRCTLLSAVATLMWWTCCSSTAVRLSPFAHLAAGDDRAYSRLSLAGDVNAQAEGGETPLHRAVQRNALAMVKVGCHPAPSREPRPFAAAGVAPRRMIPRAHTPARRCY